MEPDPSSTDESPKRSKFRRLGGLPTSTLLSLEATLAQLKNEASAIKSSGVNQYIDYCDTKVLAELKPFLLAYLSQTTEAVYPDIKGEKHEIDNNTTYEEFKKQYPKFTSDQTGAHHANLGAENCLNLYCNMLNSLKIGTPKSDGNPVVYLDKSSGGQPDKDAKASKAGGFLTAYRSVATEQYSKAMQDRCLFGFNKATKFASECTSFAGSLNGKVGALMTKLFPDFVATSEGVHLLFNWNSHSLFTYHQDEKSMVTVIVNLAPARSTFHIAGKKEAEYKEPGDAVVLPSAVWHRSGEAQRRTVKVAYFFKLMKKDEFEARTNLPPSGEPPKAGGKDTPITVVEPAPGSADPAVEPPVEETPAKETPAEEKGSGRMSNVQMFGTGGRAAEGEKLGEDKDAATGSSSAADEELKEEDAEDYEADKAVGDATSHSTCD